MTPSSTPNRRTRLDSLAAIVASILAPATLAAQSSEAPPSAPAALPAAEALSDVDPYLGEGFTPGEGPDTTVDMLEAIAVGRGGMFDPGVIGVPFDWADEQFRNVENATGFRFGIAYTMIFQQGSGGPGDRYGGSGDLDLMASWTLLGRGTKDTGQLVMAGEYRFKIGDQPASALRPVLGLLTATTGGFNDRGWVVRDFYWVQRLFDGNVRFLIGRADPSDFVATNRLQSINVSFSNRAFSANASVAFPNGHGPTAGVSANITELFYVTAGAANGYNQSNTIEIDSLFDEWDLFYFGEFGMTPKFEGVGAGRYRLFAWYMDERPELNLPSDQGLSAIFEQSFGESILAFARYSYADGTNTNIRSQVSGGVGFSGLLGAPQNLTGFALSYAQPRSDNRSETVAELFHRFQLTRFSQLTFGVQGIANPSFSAVDSLAVFTARFRVAF